MRRMTQQLQRTSENKSRQQRLKYKSSEMASRQQQILRLVGMVEDDDEDERADPAMLGEATRGAWWLGQ